MAKRIALRRIGETLVPVDDDSLTAIKSVEERQAVAADIVMLRNEGMHRAAFAFLKLAWTYWEPESFLTQAEKQTVGNLNKFLKDNGINGETTDTLCEAFLDRLNSKRAGLPVEKDFNSFRDFITVEAGFYRTVITPSGPRKEARSWAYKNMAQDDFARLFSAIKRVCWDLILNQTFESMDHAQGVANELLTFD